MIRRLRERDIATIRAFFHVDLGLDLRDFSIIDFHGVNGITITVELTCPQFPEMLQIINDDNTGKVSIFREIWRDFVNDMHIRVLRHYVTFIMNPINGGRAVLAFYIFPPTNSKVVVDEFYAAVWTSTTKNMDLRGPTPVLTNATDEQKKIAHLIMCPFSQKNKLLCHNKVNEKMVFYLRPMNVGLFRPFLRIFLDGFGPEGVVVSYKRINDQMNSDSQRKEDHSESQDLERKIHFAKELLQ
jgi:hypothetical protein